MPDAKIKDGMIPITDKDVEAAMNEVLTNDEIDKLRKVRAEMDTKGGVPYPIARLLNLVDKQQEKIAEREGALTDANSEIERALANVSDARDSIREVESNLEDASGSVFVS